MYKDEVDLAHDHENGRCDGYPGCDYCEPNTSAQKAGELSTLLFNTINETFEKPPTPEAELTAALKQLEDETRETIRQMDAMRTYYASEV